jgi:hypothetical protein
MATFSAFTAPSRCNAASWGSTGSRLKPSIEVRDPTAAAARTLQAASPGESCSTRTKNWIMVEEQYSPGQITGFGVDDQSVIDERLPVAE